MNSQLTTNLPGDVMNIAQDWSQQHSSPSFLTLTQAVVSTHHSLQITAVNAVNRMATLRNWLIGFYIVEYEQNGNDRAKYGEHLLPRLEKCTNIKGLNVTLFKYARKFYLMYPQVAKVFGIPERLYHNDKTIGAMPSHQFITEPYTLINSLSFSHLREIMTQDDPIARFFYETECIKGTWSVAELRRQIATNLYIRSGLSRKPNLILDTLSPERNNASLMLRQPMTFEFLGLRKQDIVNEKQLEDALISHLREFLLELGKGFCFEARQKRMIIDDEYFYADLVFYNRLLHCNVIIDLKNDEFKHEYLSQLNAYVSYYADKEMQQGDNPPVGILLCTRKGKKMVEYALAGMDNRLFVSTYMLQLPDKSTLTQFLIKEIKEL